MFITAIIGGETYYDQGVPCKRGGEPRIVDSDDYECRTGVIDNDVEHTEWIEYWDGDELIHRSVNMHLKQGLFAEGFAFDFAKD